MLSRSKIFKLIVLIFLQTSIFAQFTDEQDRMDHANELFDNEEFIEAEPHMLHFLSTKRNSEFNFKYGVCALFKYSDKSKSLRYLEKAIGDSKVDPRAHFYLGKANHLNYLFADALKSYNKYKSLVSEKESKILNVDMHIQMCESGKGLMKNLSDLIVEDKISTGIDKFQYSYDLSQIGGRILITDQFQSKMDQKLDYKSIIYFPPVGQDVLFFSSYGKDGETGLDIYIVNRLSTGDWSEPEKLPENINTPYDDSYPYLKPDGKTLYFSSKGHNSMGGYDIFRCSFDKMAGNYGPVNNLDYKINTPADDILYIVDDNNENAFFSSDRSSAGNEIDVYKVKVKVFPIQNTLIAGTFFNSSNPEDLKATIKVQDVKTDNLIGVYTVDKENNYSILLPNAGRYKFIVETPLSEKIHAGLVEVKPQTELKALKQEIELASTDGVENLVIRNLFDQSHENESKILAAAVKQMADPEININQIPDSILNSVGEQEIANSDDQIAENLDINNTNQEISLDNLLENNNLNISSAQNKLEDLKVQQIKSKNIAQNKANESETKAVEADRLLREASNTDDEDLKKEKLKKATQLNLESKKANKIALEAISVSKSFEEDIFLTENNLSKLQLVNEKITNAGNSENQLQLEEIENEMNELASSESSVDKLLSESKEKEKEANSLLNEAQTLRADKESMQYQLDKQKDDLSKAKKKKDISSINENISSLEEKIKESEVLIDDQFAKYEKAEQERKVLTQKVDLIEEIDQSDDVSDLSVLESIDLEIIEDKTNNVSVNYIQKNNNEFQIIEEENNFQTNDEETTEKNSINEDEIEDEISIAEELISPEEIEQYNEVSETLESTTTEVDEFENIAETIISYNNDDAQLKSEELELKKEEIVTIQDDIGNLENQLNSTTKPKKIQEIQESIVLKKSLLSNTEDQLIKSYQEINEKEIDHNEESFKSNSDVLSEKAKSDEDFMSATYYMESASKAIKIADEKRLEANKPSTPPERRKELIKEAYQNEMVAIDDQQTANNLMKDIIEKYPKTENTEQDIASKQELIVEQEIIAEEEKKKEEEFVENLPVTIPVAKKESPVEPVRFQGETFNPKAEPDNYEVVAVADLEPVVKPEEITNSSNKELLASNQKSINKVNELKTQKEILELQKNDLIDDKLVAKVEKKVIKIEKKKAKAQLKISDDVKKVNQSEINILEEQVKASQNEAEQVKDQYKVKQAENYNQSAKNLSKQAVEYREKSANVKDPIAKAELIEKAISAENTAISYLKKSKKLYSEAIVEDFSEDKLTIAKSVQPDGNKQSAKLDELANKSEDKAIEFQAKSKDIRDNINSLPKKQRADALVIANQYDELAIEQINKSETYKSKSKSYKEIELALVEDISIAEEIEGEDMTVVAGSQEFKDYNKSQNELNKLAIEREEIKVEKRGYEMLSAQMDAKAAALSQKAKVETNPIKKADLLVESEQFKIKAKENKKMADALVISIDSLKNQISANQMDQEIILNTLDSTTARKVRGLAISGKADDILDQIAEELPENDNSENEQLAKQSVVEDVIEENTIEDSPEPTANQVNIRSRDFVPPVKIVKDIFLVTQDAVYSDDNPIPLNPKLPNGLVYKVQVGAFRKPIPQDLFKGFAPISAEKVRDDITRYRVGYFTSFDIANQSKNKVRQLGYKDAFVVALMNGERIKISEAKDIQENQPKQEEIVAVAPPVQNIEETLDVELTNINIVEPLAVNENITGNLPVNTSTEVIQNKLANAEKAADIAGTFFSVQVGAFSKELTDANELNVNQLVVSKVNNLFKYSTGKFNTIDNAAKRKAELLDAGIPDAFIIAYANGKVVSLEQANSAKPEREITYKNPEIFYLDFGTYKEDVPKNISDVIMNLRPLNIRSRPMLMGKQFYSKKYNTLEDAETAMEQVKSKGLNSAKIVKTLKDDFDLNYEFKIDLGTYYEELPPKLAEAFDNLKNLNLQTIDIDDGTKYYTLSRDNYEDASTDLNACRSQDITIAKIVVFKGGVETSIDNVLKSFK
jgi:hypothetical protein